MSFHRLHLKSVFGCLFNPSLGVLAVCIFRKYGTLVNSDSNAADEFGSSYPGNSVSLALSLGQANLIMYEVMIASYTCVVDHSCSFLNKGCVSGLDIW